MLRVHPDLIAPSVEVVHVSGSRRDQDVGRCLFHLTEEQTGRSRPPEEHWEGAQSQALSFWMPQSSSGRAWMRSLQSQSPRAQNCSSCHLLHSPTAARKGCSALVWYRWLKIMGQPSSHLDSRNEITTKQLPWGSPSGVSPPPPVSPKGAERNYWVHILAPSILKTEPKWSRFRKSDWTVCATN